MDITVDVHCSLCSKRSKHTISLPDGWAHRYGGIDDEGSGFCPDHAEVADFADSQCPGCVGGWGDCPLFRSFAYSSGRDLTPADFVAIERGVCPRRVNGTITVSPKGTQTLDLSAKATTRSGVALALAIRDYCAAYPNR